MGGVSVVVEHALVTKISDETVTVPEDGYVVHIRGEASLRARFQVGERVTFSPELSEDGHEVGAWSQVAEAVGAGPRVLVQGKPIFHPAAEGFADPKILLRAGARSGSGIPPTTNST